MKIHIETAGGGGLVLLLGLAIVADHGGGISATALMEVGGIILLAVAALVVTGILLWRRLRREIPSREGAVRMIRVSPEPGELPGHARMLGPPQWRIPDDQIERIVEETLRRAQRPEQ